MMRVVVHIDQERSPLKVTSEDISDIQKAVRKAFSSKVLRDVKGGVAELLMPADKVEVSISLVANEDIKVLNRDYRGLDASTDVLSFCTDLEFGEVELLRRAGEPLPVGDIVISTEKALQQSEEFGHSFKRELIYLVVHGTLHLLGYDHQEEAQRVQMREAEEQILTDLGLTRDSKTV